MNKFITNKLVAGKNKYILLFLTLIIIMTFIFTLPNDTDKFELIIYNDYYKEIYNNLVLELLKLIIPIIILIISFEHDTSYIRCLSPSIGRDKVMTMKQLNYCFIVTMIYVFLNVIYILILSIFDYFVLFEFGFLIDLFYLYFDYLILLQLILLFGREHRKMASFLILIIYIICNFIYETEMPIIAYYLLPIYTNYFLTYKYLVIYKAFYVVLFIAINYIVNRKIDYY